MYRTPQGWFLEPWTKAPLCALKQTKLRSEGFEVRHPVLGVTILMHELFLNNQESNKYRYMFLMYCKFCIAL